MKGKTTIITCAVTGNLTRPDQHPQLPIAPSEIAAAALAATDAGAAVVHIHVRDPGTGKGSMDLRLYEEVVSRIRAQNQKVIINLTTGEGGRYVPAEEDPKVAAPGTTLCRPELRVRHIEALLPELCTLDLNTMWSGSAAVINPPSSVEEMARRIYAAGTTPEIEIFDSGDLQLARTLIERSILKAPLIVQFVLGVNFGAAATPETLSYLVSRLPPETKWGAFGVGRYAFPTVAMAFLQGGHVRVGMEDTLHIARGKLCRDNAELVSKARRIVEDLGGEVATVDDARAMLGIG